MAEAGLAEGIAAGAGDCEGLVRANRTGCDPVLPVGGGGPRALFKVEPVPTLLPPATTTAPAALVLDAPPVALPALDAAEAL